MKDAAIETLRRRHKRQWLAVRITKRDRNMTALRGILVAKARSHDEIWGMARESGLFMFFTGPRKLRAMVL